jgi:hypothetical protein
MGGNALTALENVADFISRFATRVAGRVISRVRSGNDGSA